jgi:hypothetical protein
MPIIVFGLLILFLELINPLLGRLGPATALTAKELVVVVALTLAVCCVPQSGLLRFFTPVIMLPHHYEQIEPGWSTAGVVEMVPDRMLPKVTPENRDQVVGGYVKGLARSGRKAISYPSGSGHRCVSFGISGFGR